MSNLTLSKADFLNNPQINEQFGGNYDAYLASTEQNIKNTPLFAEQNNSQTKPLVNGEISAFAAKGPASSTNNMTGLVVETTNPTAKPENAAIQRQEASAPNSSTTPQKPSNEETLLLLQKELEKAIAENNQEEVEALKQDIDAISKADKIEKEKRLKDAAAQAKKDADATIVVSATTAKIAKEAKAEEKTAKEIIIANTTTADETKKAADAEKAAKAAAEIKAEVERQTEEYCSNKYPNWNDPKTSKGFKDRKLTELRRASHTAISQDPPVKLSDYLGKYSVAERNKLEYDWALKQRQAGTATKIDEEFLDDQDMHKRAAERLGRKEGSRISYTDMYTHLLKIEGDKKEKPLNPKEQKTLGFLREIKDKLGSLPDLEFEPNRDYSKTANHKFYAYMRAKGFNKAALETMSEQDKNQHMLDFIHNLRTENKDKNKEEYQAVVKDMLANADISDVVEIGRAYNALGPDAIREASIIDSSVEVGGVAQLGVQMMSQDKAWEGTGLREEAAHKSRIKAEETGKDIELTAQWTEVAASWNNAKEQEAVGKDFASSKVEIFQNAVKDSYTKYQADAQKGIFDFVMKDENISSEMKEAFVSTIDKLDQSVQAEALKSAFEVGNKLATEKGDTSLLDKATNYLESRLALEGAEPKTIQATPTDQLLGSANAYYERIAQKQEEFLARINAVELEKTDQETSIESKMVNRATTMSGQKIADIKIEIQKGHATNIVKALNEMNSNDRAEMIKWICMYYPAMVSSLVNSLGAKKILEVQGVPGAVKAGIAYTLLYNDNGSNRIAAMDFIDENPSLFTESDIESVKRLREELGKTKAFAQQTEKPAEKSVASAPTKASVEASVEAVIGTPLGMEEHLLFKKNKGLDAGSLIC